MEAVAALSLACNVINVVDFSVTAVKLLREVYEKESSQENLDLDETATKLTNSVLVLNKTLKTSRGVLSNNEVELQLQSLASQCIQSANELSGELQYLRSKGGRLSAVKTAVISLTKKPRLEKLKKKLDQHQMLLNTGLLISLRDRVDTASVIQQVGFGKLNDELQSFIQALNSGLVRVEDLIKAEHASLQHVARVQSAETRMHVTTELENMRLNSFAKLQTQQLVDSLRYDRIYARQNQISAPQGDTFEWLYDRNRDGPWSSFPEWLESGKELFWIQGKPGSGKSCLMKFILTDARTKLHLQPWKSSSSSRILSFFFWLVGSGLQNDLHGFACSLLHQLLDGDHECVESLVATQPDLQRKRNTSDWQTQEVLDILLGLVQAQSVQTPFVFLIDGLDEFSPNDDIELLANALSALDSNENVKLCVSSRPETPIVNILNRQPSLRLQDLTAPDIKNYVSGQLEDFESRQADYLRMSNAQQGRLVTEFVRRADGVFLWIRLALREVFRGLRRGDTFDQLWSRLLKLPVEIEHLYENMLSRMGPDLELYKQEASVYLKLACITENTENPKVVQGLRYTFAPYLLYYAIAASKCIRHTEVYSRPNISLNDVLEDVRYTKLRIISCCNGLLDIDDDGSADGLDYILGARVFMVHRSVRDFLLEKPVGQHLLAKAPIDDFAISSVLIEAEVLLFSLDHRISSLYVYVTELQKLVWEQSSHQWFKRHTVQTCTLLQKRLRDHVASSLMLETRDDGQWEFKLAKKCCWQQVDFLGIIAPCISPEILMKLACPMEQRMSIGYQDYLVLCLSAMCETQFASSSAKTLFRSGARPDTEFFLPVSFPLKVTAWSSAVSQTCGQNCTEKLFHTATKDYLQLLLKAGANRNQRFLAIFKAFRFGFKLMPLHDAITLPSNLWDTVGTFIVCEVNAPILLSWNSSGKPNLAHKLGMPTVMPHLQPLAIWIQDSFDRGVGISSDDMVSFCPATEIFFDKGQAVSISPSDQLMISSLIKSCRPEYRACVNLASPNHAFEKVYKDVTDQVQHVAAKGEKVDIREYLKILGYYKPPDDPAVFQGPMQRSPVD